MSGPTVREGGCRNGCPRALRRAQGVCKALPGPGRGPMLAARVATDSGRREPPATGLGDRRRHPATLVARGCLRGFPGGSAPARSGAVLAAGGSRHPRSRPDPRAVVGGDWSLSPTASHLLGRRSASTGTSKPRKGPIPIATSPARPHSACCSPPHHRAPASPLASRRVCRASRARAKPEPQISRTPWYQRFAPIRSPAAPAPGPTHKKYISD
jgi:hypothetical protein